MPTLDMAIVHHLTESEARQRVMGLFGEIKTQYADMITDLHEKWDGNQGQFSFSVMDMAVSGTLLVKPSEVTLSCALPLAAWPFKGKIESSIRKRAESLLA